MTGLLLLTLINVPYTSVHAQPWWNFNWQYRIPITVTSQYDLYNYQLLIEVDTESLISDGKMNNDCSDIRFVDDTGTELDYWIEPQTINTPNTRIWVKIPHITESGEITIYMYYGNPSASSLSSLLNVMEDLPASDGDDYTIYYQEWIMPENRFQNVGSMHGLHANDFISRLDLPFTFPFYDLTTTISYDSDNGVYFPGSNLYATNHPIHSEEEFYSWRVIAPFAADLTTEGDGHGIFVDTSYSDEFGNGVYVRWNTSFNGGTGEQNFAVVLYENGLVRFDYGEIYGSGIDDMPVIGISRGDHVHYTLSSYNGVQYPDEYNSVMFWPRKKAATEPTYTLGSEQTRPSQGRPYVAVSVQSSSGAPFAGLDVEVWQGATMLGSGTTDRNGKVNVTANYGEVIVKVIADGNVINETTVNVVSNGQEVSIVLNCEIIIIANEDVLSSYEPDVIPYAMACISLMLAPAALFSRKRKSIQTWVAIVLAIIIAIAIAVPIYLWIATITAPSETFTSTKLIIVDTSTQAGGATITLKNMGEYTDELHAIYIKRGHETIERYGEDTPVYVITDTLHVARLGNIKLRPGTAITIIFPSMFQSGILYIIKIIGKANSIAQIEIVGG